MCRACGTQFVSCLLLRVASGGSNINDGYVTVTSCDFGFACVEVSCNSHRNVSQFYHILNGAAVSNLPSETTLWLHHFYKVLYRTWKGIFDICLYFRHSEVRVCEILLLGSFAKLRKAAVWFAMSVCLSIRPHGTAWIPLNGFSWKLLSTFLKFVEKVEISLKSDKNNGYFAWRPIYVFDHISLSAF